MEAFCINLRSRKDKKKFMVKQAKKNKINLKFFKATLHKNPVRGCLESHMSVIHQNKTKSSILILEDDATFLRPLSDLPEPPADWDLLYLGATDRGSQSIDGNLNWNRAINCWSTHAYIIRNTLYQKVLSDLNEYSHEIDRYYVEEIQRNYNCYILKDPMTKQAPGYSDIEKRYTDYSKPINHSTISNVKYPMVAHTISSNGDFILKIDPDLKLPIVSIVTVTRNRRKFIPLLVDNYTNFDYPRELLEWIIIDDGTEPIKDLLPKDPMVKYIHLTPESDTALPIGYKRNYGNECAQGEIIVHLDDDDAYFSYSVSSRVKAMITNGSECIGVTVMPCIDIQRKLGFTVGTEYSVLSEASMAYTKNFWMERKFNESVRTGESILFLVDRETRVVQIPYFFVMIALNHTSNITGNLRVIDNTLETRNGFNYLLNSVSQFTKNFIQQIL